MKVRIAVLLLGHCIALTGCSSSDKDVRANAVNTTEMVKALAEAASHVEHTRIPNDLLRPGEVDDGKSTYVPAKPLHTTRLSIVTVKHADGSSESTTTLDSKPSDFIEGIMGGAQATDAQKYAERNQEREFNQRVAVEWREWLMAIANGPIGQKLADRLLNPQAAPAAPRPTAAEQFKSLITDPEFQNWLKSPDGQALFRRLFGLDAAPAPTPATNPGGNAAVTPTPGVPVVAGKYALDRWVGGDE